METYFCPDCDEVWITDDKPTRDERRCPSCNKHGKPTVFNPKQADISGAGYYGEQ